MQKNFSKLIIHVIEIIKKMFIFKSYYYFTKKKTTEYIDVFGRLI